MKQFRRVCFLIACLFFVFDIHASQRLLTVAKKSAEQEQRRIALVIGNAAYKGAPALRNPVNDARDMSSALNRLGFEVIEVTDASQKEMLRAITSFGGRLDDQTVGLFFYAGHGMQVKGRNYIIPVDAQIEKEAAVASESVGVDTLLEQLAVSPVSIVILDACRNNPFERSFRRMGGGGLAQMDAPKGSFIAYATAPGKTAADGEGKNGLFTQELLKQINAQGLTLESVFKRVRASVAAKSNDEQMPWDSSSMTGDFFFNPGLPSTGNSSVVRLKSKEEIEQEAWDSAKASGSADVIQEFVKQYPNGRFSGQAGVQIASIKSDMARREKDFLAQRKQADGQSDDFDTVAIARYENQDNGTVIDKVSSLQWMRCSTGQAWDGTSCVGKAIRANWLQAQAQARISASFAGYSDWRLPTIDELKTLVFCSSGKPKLWNDIGNSCDRSSRSPTIAASIFPSTPSIFYWSATSYAVFSEEKWLVSFDNGSADGYAASSEGGIRLVRKYK